MYTSSYALDAQLIPTTEKKMKPQKKCVVCKEKGIRKESRYHCGDCSSQPGLCAAPCFRQYHTKNGINFSICIIVLDNVVLDNNSFCDIFDRSS